MALNLQSDVQVRITAQLIRADDGFHLWSQTWDRTLDDIFAIQDEIAADVADQLQITLLGAAPMVEEIDPEAYSLVLQARHLGRQFTRESFELSNTLYEQVLAIEPNYAVAWAGQARNYTFGSINGLLPIDEGYRLAGEAANQALTIDPENAEAYAVLNDIASTYRNDMAAAARHLERARELDPTNLDIISDAVLVARNLGRLDEAIALMKYLIARDPVNARAHGNLGVIYWYAGWLDEGIASFRTGMRLSPRRIAAQYFMGSLLLLKGEHEEALAAFAQEDTDEEYRAKGTALALWELDRQEEFEVTFAELRKRWGKQWPSEIAHVYAWIGDADAAFDPIRDDPRWTAFLEETSTSPEHLAAIKFEVRLPQ